MIILLGSKADLMIGRNLSRLFKQLAFIQSIMVFGYLDQKCKKVKKHKNKKFNNRGNKKIVDDKGRYFRILHS